MERYIGCSGYYYREWKGDFYPEKLPSTKWLQYYAQHFNTIEINSSFYKFPTEKSLSRWYKDTPDDFVFTIKANKMFTHFRKMNNIATELQQFYDVVQASLQEKTKCYLFQFPASVKYSEALLDAILALGKHPVLHTIEFRDISWWRADVYAAFQQAGLVFCNISLPDFPDVFVENAPASYLRFHGKPVLYKSGYGADGLNFWTDKIKTAQPEQLFVYFNNTWFGEAIHDARIFARNLADS